MAIMAIFHGKGFTQDTYDNLRETVNWEGHHPAGALFHAAAFDEEGDLHVVDIWDSPQELDAFVGGRLMPALQGLGVAPPAVNIYPAHNINAYAGLERYRI